MRSFKIRGAYNLISGLPTEERERGVICASAGNHAQGVAYSCAALDIPGIIYMPATTPRQKIGQVELFGGDKVEVRLIGDTFDDAYAEAQRAVRETGMTFVHPFDDARIIAGNGTVGKEIMEACKEPVDVLLVTVGGGGLAAGVAAYVKAVSPNTRIIGVEPEGAPRCWPRWNAARSYRSKRSTSSWTAPPSSESAISRMRCAETCSTK